MNSLMTPNEWTKTFGGIRVHLRKVCIFQLKLTSKYYIGKILDVEQEGASSLYDHTRIYVHVYSKLDNPWGISSDFNDDIAIAAAIHPVKYQRWDTRYVHTLQHFSVDEMRIVSELTMPLDHLGYPRALRPLYSSERADNINC